MARGRILCFQQITDSRNLDINECLPVLSERIEKIKKLLNIEGIHIEVGEPYLIDWTETIDEDNIKNAKENPSMKDYYLKDIGKKKIQYRANFKIEKNTRKITWNDIYKLINSVKAVPYNFR